MARSILITDIAHFVGGPSARALLAEGASVYGVDARFSAAAARAAFEEKVPGVKTLPMIDPKEAVAAVIEAEGRLDVLINNDAWPAVRGPVDEATDKDMHETFEALVFKSFAMTRAAAPAMKVQQAGKILFLSSAAPLNGIPNYSLYAAARGATNSLALTLAKELASFNIQVNALAFNFIENPDYFPASLLDDPKSREKILSNIPLRRLGKPEEAAAIVAFLAGPLSDFITGQLIPVAGGWATAR
ncbi:MAG: short-chain dehydrogenase [Alphaproteobacteria bacterium HGW-Alphaproteobacteria-12]|nr:MAG: short-chain dehydrogenase [Alphaproteobacteria bacterium HGW-Alphaproteobacteria-12]